MRKPKWEILCDALSIVGESPIWDHKNRILHYVDIHGKRLRSIDYSTGAIRDLVLPQQIGAVVLSASGELIGCMNDGVYKVRPDGRTIPMFAPLPLHGSRFNDAKAGPDGALYGGTIHYGGEGGLYRLTPDGEFNRLLNHVGNSNGLDWDVEQGWFYYNDTPTMKTDRFRFENGFLHSRETVRHYLPSDGNPDGMTMDSEGKLWVALWGHGQIWRIDPVTGVTLQTLKLPVSNVACCAFAGDDLRDLIVTTAAHNTDLRKEPLAGALFRFKADVPGRPAYRFG